MARVREPEVAQQPPNDLLDDKLKSFKDKLDKSPAEFIKIGSKIYSFVEETDFPLGKVESIVKDYYLDMTRREIAELKASQLQVDYDNWTPQITRLQDLKNASQISFPKEAVDNEQLALLRRGHVYIVKIIPYNPVFVKGTRTNLLNYFRLAPLVVDAINSYPVRDNAVRDAEILEINIVPLKPCVMPYVVLGKRVIDNKVYVLNGRTPHTMSDYSQCTGRMTHKEFFNMSYPELIASFSHINTLSLANYGFTFTLGTYFKNPYSISIGNTISQELHAYFKDAVAVNVNYAMGDSQSWTV